MNSKNLTINYLLLFLPYLVAELISSAPVISYLIAWTGSWLIFYLSISGKIVPLPADRPLSQQIMRPLILTQLVFAGYMCITSVFFFMELNGFYYLSYEPLNAHSLDELMRAVECQRYYCLGHASYATGLLLFMKYRPTAWRVSMRHNYSWFFFRLALMASLVSFMLRFAPGLSQVRVVFVGLNLVASVFAFSTALIEKKQTMILGSSLLFFTNMVQAILGGWKEEVIILILLLGFFTYPYYKRTVTITMPLLIAVWLVFIPTFNQTFRALNWSGDAEATVAASAALESVRAADEETLKDNNWDFLIYRFSEISMFMRYVEQVPAAHDYYGATLLYQSLIALVPRALWSGKPVTEVMVMQRVYELGVIDVNAIVSAKPPYIVDSYLSGGAIGIFLLCMVLGASASIASRKAEEWFGGYLLGSALMYNSFFQFMWRANSFEFILNNFVWAFILMYLLFRAGRYTGYIYRDAPLIHYNQTVL